MFYLKQSTASQEVPLGRFVDSTDGDTEETALTIANTDIKIWKTGAITLANKNSGGATHISNGVYYTVLDATDTNTLGPLKIFVHVAGALDVVLECCVLPAKVYDALIAGSDNLEVDLIQWLGTAPLALSSQRVQALTAAMSNNVITANTIAADALGASELAADAVTEIVNGVLAGVIEGTLTLQQVQRILLAVLAGKSTGGGTATANFRDNADAKNRVQATVDANGNRTAITLDAT